jgi:hypothetical protein
MDLLHSAIQNAMYSVIKTRETPSLKFTNHKESASKNKLFRDGELKACSKVRL